MMLMRFAEGIRLFNAGEYFESHEALETARKIILNHPQDHVLFGSDSPWADQEQAITLLESLDLGKDRERLILREHALKLLAAV